MKTQQSSRLTQILESDKDETAMLRRAGVIAADAEMEPEAAPALDAEPAIDEPEPDTGILAAKYYDIDRLKEDMLTEVGASDLKNLEISPGVYEVMVDFIGDIETAAQTFGLEEIGIKQTEDGQYELDGQTAGSVAELQGAQEAVDQYAAKVAESLIETVGLPGAFYFSRPEQYGDGALRLFFAFENANLEELQQKGAAIEVDLQEVDSSFQQILSALEQEGCHDIAVKLHQILLEN